MLLVVISGLVFATVIRIITFHLCLLATEYHLGLLKAKLAKYRSELLEPPKNAGAKVNFVFKHV